jgi:hypothetical protein
MKSSGIPDNFEEAAMIQGRFSLTPGARERV